MTKQNAQRLASHLRSGSAITYVAVMGTLLIGFAALAVDAGNLYRVRAELQNAADASALAGALAYLDPEGLTKFDMKLAQNIIDYAQDTSKRNATLGQPTLLPKKDILIGHHDFDNTWGPLGITSDADMWNAVDTTVRRTRKSQNGPVPLIFAPIFGRFQGSVIAHARAAVDDRVAGVRLRTAPFLPFSIDERLYELLSETGPDDYSYEDGILRVGDGIRELKLFPWRRDFTEEELAGELDPAIIEEEFAQDAAGNFGTLVVGVGIGTSGLAEQITKGVSNEELAEAFGTPDLVFFDDAGNHRTYPILGNPGLSNGIADEVQAKLGDIIGFFIHEGITLNGANADFAVSGVRFGRVVEVGLHETLKQRTLTVQPVPMSMGDLILDDGAPSTRRHLGRVVLVQ